MFTATSAEYGLLRCLMEELDADAATELAVLASGAHLSREHGYTVEAIAEDGFDVAERVEMLLSSDSPTGVAKSFGLGVVGYADALARLDPDVLVVLGDRYETLAAAVTAVVLRIPLAHVAGGQVTSGSLDDSFRHAVSKLAGVHYVSTEAFRTRVIQLGEEPERVVTVGALGLDAIRRTSLLGHERLAARLGLDPERPYLLVTLHAPTSEPTSAAAAVEVLLAALEQLTAFQVVLTEPGADAGGRHVAARLRRYCEQRGADAVLVPSLGTTVYLSAMAHARAVVGNSSSGLIEAPALATPTVNIGLRQHGRPRAASVLDCPFEPEAIARAVTTAASPAFHRRIAGVTSPYGDGHAAARIHRHLREADLPALLYKSFRDLV